ncbi:hypothetical protein ACFVTT_38725 [Streptomyces niveus]|uniref:hypothetical protein n=1 Tax=Streptomyces niveus TaxID=193462 RepID=UPI0034306321
MRPEMLTALAALGVAAVTAIGGIMSAVIGRRQPRGQGRRDDFATVTARLDKDIERLEGRVTRQETKMAGQSAAIGYLLGWIRELVSFVRRAGLEPPAVAPPPEEAKPYLHDIGV